MPDDTPTTTAIELKNVSFRNEGFQVLENISVEFPLGETTIIMGPSGCGKSSLLKIAAGLFPPDQGDIEIDGKSMSRFSQKETAAFRKRSSFVFQDAALWSNQTIQQNLEIPLKFHFPHLKAAAVQEKVAVMIDHVGYDQPTNLRPSQLSIGERKLISIARALITEPDLVFLDQPMDSIDAADTDRIHQLMKNLKEKRTTLLIVTHNPKVASQLSDRLVVIAKGRVIAQGAFRQVVRSINPEVQGILKQVLNEASSFDDDILELLSEQ